MKFLEPWSLILILVVVLILFGPKRLPDLGKSFRKSMKAFQDEAQGTTEAEEGTAAQKTSEQSGEREPEKDKTRG